ncbi:CinA family nicotinamide mononucleotide deamidase-related protein [uncultured Mesonia sp.]|uniref:CinA family nicotinamide mononucleotide deamidase-related protein n=1 Tax=uncultured Mesonia sp. TaxID=399731 RepID=UPI00374ED318
MNAEIITIGDEILIGQITDTNSAFLAQELNKIGVEVTQITSIQDHPTHIFNALKKAEAYNQIIIITGGLGPTKDDKTKETLCNYFQDELVENLKVLSHIEDLFEKYIETSSISKLNRDQAYIPSKAIALKNEFGTAPGMWFFENGKVYISMPGVPYEMKNIFTKEALPRLAKTFERPYIIHKTALTYGVGESTLAKLIEDWENNLPSFIKLAYLPSLGKVRLRLSARGGNKEILEQALKEAFKNLKSYIGGYIKGFEGETSIEEEIARKFNLKNQHLALAESCTGGQIASSLVNVPGASSYFLAGLVTYATQMKIDLLKIEESIIQKYSVVSKEVTLEMAKKVKQQTGADVALATTGNAGPTKGDSQADIGQVYIALVAPGVEKVFSFLWKKNREKIIEKAVVKAQQILLEENWN